jgi:transcription elongation factor GreA
VINNLIANGGLSMYDKITYKDVMRMKEEIEYRKLVVRKEALEDVKEARAHGDLSENFEYKAAKQYKNQNESRIRYLERMIKTAVIIPEDSDSDEVGINDKVTIYYPEDDEEEIIKIVTSVRSNSLKGRISIDSPLGKELLHHKVGDRIKVNSNNSTNYEIIIRKIEKLEDNGEDELRKY